VKRLNEAKFVKATINVSGIFSNEEGWRIEKGKAARKTDSD
jgi:hypothetical protein